MSSKVPSYAVSSKEQFQAGYAHWIQDPRIGALWIPTINDSVLQIYFPDADAAFPTREGAVEATRLHVGRANLPEEWFGEEHTYFDQQDNITPFSVAVKQYVPQRDNPRFMKSPKLKKEASSRSLVGYDILRCDEFLDDTSSCTSSLE